MPDKHLYETTDISAEGEWYYLSKRVRGRMAEQTEWDYTEFLNDWHRFKIVKYYYIHCFIKSNLQLIVLISTTDARSGPRAKQLKLHIGYAD